MLVILLHRCRTVQHRTVHKEQFLLQYSRCRHFSTRNVFCQFVVVLNNYWYVNASLCTLWSMFHLSSASLQLKTLNGALSQSRIWVLHFLYFSTSAVKFVLFKSGTVPFKFICFIHLFFKYIFAAIFNKNTVVIKHLMPPLSGWIKQQKQEWQLLILTIKINNQKIWHKKAVEK